jgi:hypothetical protein
MPWKSLSVPSIRLIAVLTACRPAAVTVGPLPSLEGTALSGVGRHSPRSPAQLEKDLLGELAQFDSMADILELSADFAVANEVAANALADWLRRLDPSAEQPRPPSPDRGATVTIEPPSSGRGTLQLDWGPVWGLTVRSRPKLIRATDIRRWVGALAQVSLDTRWRLVSCHVGRPLRPQA